VTDTAASSPQALRSRVESAWTRVRVERMSGLPILNPVIGIEAVGAREWRDDWLTVLVTPWSINVLLLPGAHSDWSSLKPGASIRHVLPAGAFSFIVGDEPGFGRYQMCSLFSPVLEFDSHQAAVVAAGAALDALFAADDSDAASDESFMHGLATGRRGAATAAREDEAEPVRSRRDFLAPGVAGGGST